MVFPATDHHGEGSLCCGQPHGLDRVWGLGFQGLGFQGLGFQGLGVQGFWLLARVSFLTGGLQEIRQYMSYSHYLLCMFNGHGLVMKDIVGDYTKLQEGPYVHCKGFLHQGNIEGSSYR